MAETSYPFAASLLATELQWSDMFRILGTGVDAGELNELEVFADSSGPQVKLRTGQARIRGHQYKNDTEKPLAVAAADPTNPRIDRVVLRRSYVSGNIFAAVIQGTPAVTPVAPALTQVAIGTWEISLAQVRVDAAVVTIAANKITSERTFSGPAMVKIGHYALTADAANIDITSIPLTYQQLRLVYSIRSARAANAEDELGLRLNNISTGTYDSTWLSFYGVTYGSGQALASTSGRVVAVVAATATAGNFSGGDILIPDYANAARNKTFVSSWGGRLLTSSDNGQVGTGSGVLQSSQAQQVSRLTLISRNGANLLAGSSVTLYGLMA